LILAQQTCQCLDTQYHESSRL